MHIQPIKDPVTFGIYKGSKTTHYGHKDYGVYKEHNIEVYHDTKDNMKLQYVSDKFRNFIKSKLIYFDNGIKKIARAGK